MDLGAALSIAGSGLANVNAQLALVSHNVANASTPSYSVENLSQQELTAGGVGMGVVTGPATRTVDAELQSELMNQNATVAGLQTTQTALASIDAVNGTPGQGSDLASLLGNLEDQFSILLNEPDNATQQSQVVTSAATLAQGINTLSNTYTAQRQTAENNIVSEVNTINQTLGTIGSLSNEIITAQSSGQSTADLENERDAQVASLSQLVSINTLVQPNGDMLITTGTGTNLPTHGATNPLSTSGANLEPGSYYPGGGVPGIMLGGVDVTDQLRGGSLGANITLRDSTLPTYQGELDEFAQNLASRFAAQGLDLFTDAAGNVPSGGGMPVQSGYVGFASEIQVNPAVQSDPAVVTDGTDAITGSATGASAFTPNPAGGPAGFTTLITRVLDYTFGADAQPGVAQPASNTTGLGPAGTLSAPYQPQPTLADTASALVGAESSDSATATSQLDTAQTLQSTLQSKLTNETGVNMDTEMSDMIALQNAYGANAKVMAAVQSMFTQLLELGDNLMSGSVSAASPTDYGLISGLVSDGAAIRQKLDTLTQQAGDGLVADTYAGLGTGASVSLDLNPEIASMQTWQNNINSVTGSMDVTQTTMTQIQGIASNLYSQLYGLEGTDGSEVSSIAASAQNALTEVANLLDATNGNTYVFSGADSSNPPVPDPGNILSSGFYTQIAAAVGNLGSAGASATAAATLAIASSNVAGTSPFSSYMSQAAATLQAQMPQVQTGQGQTVAVGLLASANTSVASTGSSTTGSYMRDLMRALATIGSLTSAQQSDPGFQGLVEDTMTSLNGAISAMAEDTGVLGNTQSALSTTQTTLADTQTALTAQVSSVQDVNMASTLSNLSLVETQLQASYQVIATVSQLSLVKFLPAD